MAVKNLIILAGPTAVGKTHCSIWLAEHFNAGIFSADSRQLYRELTIGTAKPGLEICKRIPHHFIDHISIHDHYDAGTYEKEMIVHLDQYFTTHDVAILTGGTGLYIKAVTDGLDEFPDVSQEITDNVQADFSQHGISFLQEELRSSDPAYFKVVDLQNPHRLIRAISVIRQSKKPYSSFLGTNKTPRSFQPVFVLLDRDREELYDRINRRVDRMMDAGLLAEAEGLFPFKHLKSLQTVGYRELFRYLEGKITLPQAVELIKRNTRHYAKRQLTWFRADKRWTRFHPNDEQAIMAFVNRKVCPD